MYTVKELFDTYNPLIQAGADSFWGGLQYHLFFLLGLLAILFLEKDRANKLGMAGYSLLVLAALHCPLVTLVCVKVFGYSVPYYARLFSLLPVVLVIPYGATLLCTRTEKGIKLLSVLLVTATIIAGGSLIYDQGWPYKSANSGKISTDAIQIADLVDTDPDHPVTVAVQDHISVVLRQYDANIVQPYGRQSGTWLSQILGYEDVGDVSAVLTAAGNYACDYIAVLRTDTNLARFADFGLTPYGETNSYLIYRVTGVPHLHKEYNDLMQTASITYLDATDAPYLCSNGYATIAYTYDDRGRTLSELYYDESYAPIALANGSCGLLRTYDTSGNVTSITYVDAELQPVMNTSCKYASIECVYNEEKQKVQETYYDVDGSPMIMAAGHSGVQWSYDENGCVTRIVYIDGNCQPINTTSLYASIDYTYNESKQKTQELYYDQNGAPVALANGSYGAQFSYDEYGCTSKIVYLGSDLSPVVITSGYASIEYVYNSSKQKLQETYYDVDGNPMIMAAGHSGVQWSYDEQGCVTRIVYIDGNCQPVNTTSLYASIDYTYNDSKQKTQELYYDQNGAPVALANGSYGAQFTYDEYGYNNKVVYLGFDLSPVVITSGYASIEYVYNSSKQKLQEAYYDVDGSPMIMAAGHSGIQWTYDGTGLCQQNSLH